MHSNRKNRKPTVTAAFIYLFLFKKSYNAADAISSALSADSGGYLVKNPPEIDRRQQM
jgi:hypothetical protein